MTSYNSFRELSPDQQEMLVNELFGAANAVAILNIIKKAFWNIELLE